MASKLSLHLLFNKPAEVFLLLVFLSINGQEQPVISQQQVSADDADGWQCPAVAGVKNSHFFDTSQCDPGARFGCATGFKCRLALKRDDQQQKANLDPKVGPGQQTRFLCCESRQLGIGEWLLDAGLAPAVFPQVPNVTLLGAVFSDTISGRKARVDENGAELSLLLGPEGTAGGGGGGNFTQLDSIFFESGQVPPARGFLHILEAIDQFAQVSALRLHFDYPSFGSTELDLHAHSKRFPRGFVQAIGPGFVPRNDFYRRQQVLLLFRSDLPLGGNRSADIERWMAGSEGKFAKLMWENGSGMPALLGPPWAGLIFNMTTRESLFPVTFGTAAPGQSAGTETVDKNNSNNAAVEHQLAYEPGLMNDQQQHQVNNDEQNRTGTVNANSSTSTNGNATDDVSNGGNGRMAMPAAHQFCPLTTMLLALLLSSFFINRRWFL